MAANRSSPGGSACPALLLPQQTAEPSVRRAQTLPAPTLMRVNRSLADGGSTVTRWS